MEQIDCRGLMCPQPVIHTKKFIEAHAGVEALSVLVDNAAAKENVTRFLENQGFSAQVSEAGGVFTIDGKREGKPESLSGMPDDSDSTRTLVFITSDLLGTGDPELGEKLMASFIATLNELGEDLWRIILLNAGVKLAAAPGNILDSLKGLSAEGISILVCGTCLTHYGLLEQKQVGETTNMMDVISSLQLAEKIIKI